MLENLFWRQIESPHFPKVYAFIGTSHDAWAAVMEKLHKVQDKPGQTTKAVQHASWRVMHDPWGDRARITLQAWERAPLPKTQKAGVLHAMRQLAEAGFAPTDVHRGNIMRRRSRIVMTDVVM